MRKYEVQYIHKVREPQEIPDGAFSDSKALGAALRKARLLHKGQRLSSFRVEGDKVVAFPEGSIWHSLIITLVEEDECQGHPAGPGNPQGIPEGETVYCNGSCRPRRRKEDP